MAKNDQIITNGWRDTMYYSDGHQISWIRGGRAYFDEMNTMIREARTSVHLQVYIIDSDETGLSVILELISAARRGVDVFVVVDDFGTGKLQKQDEERMIAAGVNFKRFEPFLSTDKFYVGRRLHHKVLVTDEKYALVSGLNIADRYRGTTLEKPWIDYAIRIEGNVSRELVSNCKVIYDRTFKPAPPRFPRLFQKKRFLDPSKVWVRVRRNDWLRNYREITQSYNNAVRLAAESIVIVGGYFLPGRKFLRLLSIASKRGVVVEIILTQQSDSMLVKLASEYLYNRLLKSNIRIFEATTSMVHGKACVVDGIWTTIGSYNQNHLSAYLSIELNIDVVNREFSSAFGEHLRQVIQLECVEITNDSFLKITTTTAKLKRWGAYQVARIMMRVLLALNRIFGLDD